MKSGISLCLFWNTVFILRGFKFLPVIFTLRIIKRTISFPPSLSRAPDTLTLTITASRNPISGKQAVIFFPRSRLRFLRLVNFCNLLVCSAKTVIGFPNYFAWKPVENLRCQSLFVLQFSLIFMSTARKESRAASFQALLPKSFVVNPLRVLEDRFSVAETMATETVCRKSTFKDDNDVFSTLKLTDGYQLPL